MNEHILLVSKKKRKNNIIRWLSGKNASKMQKKCKYTNCSPMN